MADDEMMDLISGKPLEPWAEQAMERGATMQRVPREPTREMIAAGERAIAAMPDNRWGKAERAYRAMLAYAERNGLLAYPSVDSMRKAVRS